MNAYDHLKAALDEQEPIFSHQEILQSHLGYEAIRTLKQNAFKTIVTDAYRNNQKMNGIKLLAAAIVFADWIRENIPSQRVGVVLPTGLAATIVNLACALANKTAVNLNFTTGRGNNEACIKKAGIESIITADAVKEKLPDFPWTHRVYDIAGLIKEELPLWKVALWALLGLILPTTALARLIGTPNRGGDQEAAILFTSGSSGEPKGVVLTHKNILANIIQTNSVLGLIQVEIMLGSLPVFHSFGFTVGMWWPLLGGPRVVTYINPTETGKLCEIIEQHKVQIMIVTPTFLRAFLRKAKPEQLNSLKIIITGAEKLPEDLRIAFEDKFKISVSQGYGMTEASPVISSNLLNMEEPVPLHLKRDGSVGKVFPGINVRVRNPETKEDLKLTETGMLWFKGANVFNGYLDDPQRSAEVLEDGWYCSGDLGRLDEDGFLHIEGRLTRFSKIGGEMIPHGTLESKLIEAYGKQECEELVFMVTGIPDDQKGEALVLLTTIDIDPQDLRKKLNDAGLPNLWVPKTIQKVDKIPVLASGKLDIQKCRDLAHSAPKEKAVLD